MKFMQAFVSLMLFTLSISGYSHNYTATIQEGTTAANEALDKKDASAISISLVSPTEVLWNASFGMANPVTSQALTDTTMFGIGSISKVFAAISVMKLVEQGLIQLDEPIYKHIPSFRMKSPQYKKITARMLINHSAGFPGTDYRNALIRTRYDGYLNQVLNTLSQSRLKTPPGYMSVYCNDCFTVVEALVAEKTGKSYAQFVQDEIFTPLGMNNTRFPLKAFPENDYAKAYVKGIIKPQEYVNTLGSGGIYSTSKDMARFAMMFLNSGTLDKNQIISEASIAKMAEDQTIGSFNPFHYKSFAYGLGWDTVSQPGLLAVGFDGWAKGGDSNDYSSYLIVSPKAKLGVVVMGVSNFSSEKAKAIAERLLLRALSENQLIPAFPSRLVASQPEMTQDLPSYVMPNGEFDSNYFSIKFEKQTNENVVASILANSGWGPGFHLQKNNEGWFINPDIPLTQFNAINVPVSGELHQYLLKRAPEGYGHYFDTMVYAQKLNTSSKHLSPVWKGRLNKTWVVVNAHPDELTWNNINPSLQIKRIPDASHLIAVNLPDQGTFQVLNPSKSNSKATMMLTIPGMTGRDLNDLVITKHKGKEWIGFGSYIYQPLSAIPKLPIKKTTIIRIGPKGHTEWRVIKSHHSHLKISINTSSEWQLYDSQFKIVQHGKGKAEPVISSDGKPYYLAFSGVTNDTMAVSVTPASSGQALKSD